MKKYLPYILTVLVLGGLAAWFALRPAARSVNEIEGDFAVKDVNDITRISIENHEKEHVELTKKDGKWWVDDAYIVRDDMIKQVLNVVTKIESLTPVPSNGHDNVMRELTSEYIKVDIYTGDSEPEKSYFVGGPTVDSKGTYMLLDMGDKVASRPHIGFVPGYQGFVTPMFSTKRETWRSRLAFQYGIADIKSLKVEYPEKPENSFVINKVSTDSFTVSPLNEQFRINEKNEQKYVQQYLNFYSSVAIEAFDNEYSKKDSVLMIPPACKFTITDNDGKVNEFVLYHMPINKRSKEWYDDFGRELKYDSDRYFGTMNGGKDFVIVQYVVFGKLLRSYKDFYYKPGSK